MGMRRQTVEAGRPARPASPRLLRDPAAWLVATLVIFASGYAMWQLLGLGTPPLAAATGGAGTIPGAIVVGIFAHQVFRGRILGELDRRARWLIVVVCALYLVSGFTTPSGGTQSTPGSQNKRVRTAPTIL